MQKSIISPHKVTSIRSTTHAHLPSFTFMALYSRRLCFCPSVYLWRKTSAFGCTHRNFFKGTILVFTASTLIVPLEISVNLNNAVNRELFPLPVRPTMPIFSPECVSKVTSFKEYVGLTLQVSHINKEYLCVLLYRKARIVSMELWEESKTTQNMEKNSTLTDSVGCGRIYIFDQMWHAQTNHDLKNEKWSSHGIRTEQRKLSNEPETSLLAHF